MTEDLVALMVLMIKVTSFPVIEMIPKFLMYLHYENPKNTHWQSRKGRQGGGCTMSSHWVVAEIPGSVRS